MIFNNGRMSTEPVQVRGPLPQAMALAMVVAWSFCVVADVTAGPALLAMTQTTRLPRVGQSGERHALEQWKGHLKLAVGQFRLQATPTWWLATGFHAQLSAWESLVRDHRFFRCRVIVLPIHRLLLEPLSCSHHLNLPPP